MDFEERYKYDPEQDQIGTGGFSKIYKAYDNLREEAVALKFFSGDVKEKYGIVSEAKRLLKLNHPNVIRFYDLQSMEFTNIHNQSEKVLVGVLEYVAGSDLKKGTKQQLSNKQKLEITKGLLDGLKYIHSKNLIHRDLKPGNVMLKYEGNQIIPKLIDFGISKNTEENTSSSSQLLGTVEYMAPEQFNPEKHGKVGPVTDLWSFGVMVYELYSGKRLFGSRGDGQQTEHVIAKILLEEIELDFSDIPKNIEELLNKCLIRNTSDRAKDVEELINVFSAPEAVTVTLKKEDKTSQSHADVIKRIIHEEPTDVESTKMIQGEMANQTLKEEIVEDDFTKVIVEENMLTSSSNTRDEESLKRKSNTDNQTVENSNSTRSFPIIEQEINKQTETKKKVKKMIPWLILVIGVIILLAVVLFSKADSRIKTSDYPLFEKILTEFNLMHPEVEVPWNNETKGKIEFSKRPEGYFLQILDEDGVIFSEELFWDRKKEAYLSTGPYQGFKDVKGISKTKGIQLDYQQISFDDLLFHNYPTWQVDVIKELEGKGNLTLKENELLARAYGALGSGYIQGGQFGNVNPLISDLGPIPNYDVISEERSSKGFEYAKKTIELYSLIRKEDSNYNTFLIGDIDVKEPNEKMHYYQSFMQIKEEEKANFFLENCNYKANMIAIAKNYLDPVPKNGVFISAGDSDYYPLLYVQKKMGYRTDVVITNSSLLNVDRELSYLVEQCGLKTSLNKEAYESQNNGYVLINPFSTKARSIADLVQLVNKNSANYLEASFDNNSIKCSINGKNANIRFDNYLLKGDYVLLDLINSNPNRIFCLSYTETNNLSWSSLTYPKGKIYLISNEAKDFKREDLGFNFGYINNLKSNLLDSEMVHFGYSELSWIQRFRNSLNENENKVKELDLLMANKFQLKEILKINKLSDRIRLIHLLHVYHLETDINGLESAFNTIFVSSEKEDLTDYSLSEIKEYFRALRSLRFLEHHRMPQLKFDNAIVKKLIKTKLEFLKLTKLKNYPFTLFQLERIYL